jgi:predicted amidohydrolase YtcJ
MLADFAVLSDDLFSVDPDRIDRLTDDGGETVIGGHVVHNDGALR